MSARTTDPTADLVFHQYTLCSYASDLELALRDLKRLSKTSIHANAAIDGVMKRLSRLRDEVIDGVRSIDDAVGRRHPAVA